MITLKPCSISSIFINCKNLLQIRSKIKLSCVYASTKTLEMRLGLPEKPKKPLTPYFRYMQEERPAVVASNPTVHLTEIVRIIAKKWGTVDEKTKRKLEEEFKKEQVSYIEKITKYETDLTDEQRQKIKNYKINEAESKEKSLLRKRYKELGKPKRPASAFIKFINTETVKKLHEKDMPYREWQMIVAQKWKSLSDDEKEKFTKLAKNEAQKYRIDLSTWEEKMIRLGNIDVVRHDSMIETPPPKPHRRLPSKTSSPALPE